MNITARRATSALMVIALAAWSEHRPAEGQVPAPHVGSSQAAELRESRQAIEDRESRSLATLARTLASRGDGASAAAVRRLIPAAGAAGGGATRLSPLPDVVPKSTQGLASVASGPRSPARSGPPPSWQAELETARKKAASEYLELAKRAAGASPPRLAEAALCLRLVLDRDPDHAEARRLMGYVPHQGGWARPFAVRQLKMGLVNHPTFGWVEADWVPHLDAGELPSPQTRGSGPVRWLPAAEADRLRSDWKPPWQIKTEHFVIQTNVPLDEAIEFGRRLEAFYDVFFTLMADAIGENLPLFRRFRSPALTGEGTYKPHQISYFASKQEYVERLRAKMGREAEQSLGYYDPPRPGNNRSMAYFFRDVGGQLPVTATLYHEVSHQLLFETAGPNAFTKNAGNYWVFEGLGTYFETVTPQADGSLEVGGLVGERIEAARHTLADGRFEPLDQFVQLDQGAFNRADRIHDHYQQAMALAIFLMQAEEQAHRDAFLEYVRDAYRGRIKRSTGRSLEDRLGEPLNQVDARFRAFLARADRQP